MICRGLVLSLVGFESGPFSERTGTELMTHVLDRSGTFGYGCSLAVTRELRYPPFSLSLPPSLSTLS